MTQKEPISDIEFVNIIVDAYEDGEFDKLESLLQKGNIINNEKVAEGLLFCDFTIDNMEKLAALGFDVNVMGKWSRTPYWFSFFNDFEGDIELAKRILNIKGLDINAGSEKGYSILFKMKSILESVTNSHFAGDFVKLLLEKGLKPDTLSKEVRTALFFAGDYPEISKLLVSTGLDINTRDHHGHTPFSYFCYTTEKSETVNEYVQSFIELGADIHSEITIPDSDKTGMTPLFWAIKSRNLPLVKSLLSKGVEKNHVSQNDLTALEVALGTQKSELVDLFFDEFRKDYHVRIKSKLVGYYMALQDWNEVLRWGLQIDEAELESWEVLHQISYAYRKNDDIYKAEVNGLKAIKKFGYNNYLIDNMIYIYVISARPTDAIKFWHECKNSFDPKGDAAANTVGHIIVAYDQLKKHAEGIDELKKYADLCHGTTEGRKGFSQFNFACLYGEVNDIAGVIHYAAVAISADYDAPDFEYDSCFDSVREHMAFKILMDYSIAKTIYIYLEKGNQYVKFYTRYNDEYELVKFDGKRHKSLTIKVESVEQMVFSVYEKYQEYVNNSYVESSFNYTEKWIPVWDDIFKQIKDSTTEPLGELRLEWDFNSDNGDDYNTLERPYYAYSDNGFDIDHYDFIAYIPSKSIFKDVLTEIIKLDSFKKLKKSKEVKLIQSEHDGGDEFTYVWKK